MGLGLGLGLGLGVQGGRLRVEGSLQPARSANNLEKQGS